MNKTIDYGAILLEAAGAFAAGEFESYKSKTLYASQILAKISQAGQLDTALALEPLWYNKLVKLRESEENYFDAFSGHSNAFWLAGKELSEKHKYTQTERDPNRCAFILHTGVLLGHTEVMLRVLRNWVNESSWIIPSVISLNGMHSALADELNKIGVPWFCPQEELGPTQRVKWTRDVCTQNLIESAVWLSTPCWVSYVFGYGVAPKQILWSLKFHPVHLGDDVLHIGMTKPSSEPVQINGCPWVPFSPPLATAVKKIPRSRLDSERAKFPNHVLVGTLAREEKYNSDQYLSAIVRILERAPNTHFLYTGKKDSKQLKNALADAGLSGRATFIGWVDTNLYAQVLDVFLETFPFGCGVTGAQAVEHGANVVSLWGGETLPTYYFKEVSEAEEFAPTWRVTQSVEDYVGAALSAIASVETRSSVDDNTASAGKLSVLDERKPEQLRRLFRLPDQPKPA